MKWVSIFSMMLGLFFIGISGYEYMKTNRGKVERLYEAHEILNEKRQDYSDLQKLTAFKPLVGDTTGILFIPKLNYELPIIEGTNEEELAVGVGHFRGSAYPTEQDQIVLSGHRDTVFRRMGELEIGDLFIIHVPYGSFTYEIESTKIVEANDTTVIQSTAPKEILTVTTCYPFTFVGNAPKRYVITAIPITE